jgi:hypothetical protein
LTGARTGAVAGSRSAASTVVSPSSVDATAPWARVQKWHASRCDV